MKHLFIAACCCLASAGFAAEPFEIRGVLPWHNFLCGPTAWNKADYEVYLDNCEAEGINFIGFHNYTGGGERYATYVEPMVRISYRGIVPQAMLDNSLSCRWGALPLRLKEFAFGSQRALDVPRGAEAFGSDCSLISKTPDEHYRNTQRLMRDVLRMAHDRDIEMAMGFEFGVVPPEYFSLYAAGSCFFWLGAGNMVPNPCHPTSVELHRAALDDLLENYPDIDYVWLWLNEHSFLGVVVEQALGDPAFAEVFRRESGHFEEAQSDSERFVGVWSLEYIRRTLDHLRQKGSRAKLIIGGGGGGGQLPGILRGLDRALPEEVVFSCLNPDLGRTRQPEFLADIARHRKVWAVPWLEGDNQMWHQQPRVGKMRDHVQLAREQGLPHVRPLRPHVGRRDRRNALQGVFRRGFRRAGRRRTRAPDGRRRYGQRMGGTAVPGVLRIPPRLGSARRSERRFAAGDHRRHRRRAGQRADAAAAPQPEKFPGHALVRVAAGQGRTGDGSGLGAARQNPCGEPSRIARSLRRGAPRVGIRPRRRADPHLCFAHRVTRRNGHPDLDQPATMEQLPAAEKLPARKHALK